ncbi:hypothetical protein Tco_0630053 [Tanacetum coccineum]
MRMEQHLQCIDYTLWEIIENGNAPIVTKNIDGKETAIPPTSVEEKAQKGQVKGTDIQEKNKKKAKSKQIRARNGKDKVKSQDK